MKKLNIMLAAGLSSLLFMGCTSNQPSFDSSTKEIKTVDGKHYMVPVGASASNYAVDSKVIKRFQEFGVSDCKDGDITWEDQKIAEDINAIMRRNANKSEGIAIYKKAASEGEIGCASPLSDEEYKSYLKK
jgi:hypothetical protein